MRFYKVRLGVKHYNPEDSQDVCRFVTEWFGSERDAVIKRLELFKDGKLIGKKNYHHILSYDIATSKAGLLEFLREEVV